MGLFASPPPKPLVPPTSHSAAVPALYKAVCLRVDGSGSGEVDVEDGTEGGPQGRDKLDGAVGGDGVRNAEP